MSDNEPETSEETDTNPSPPPSENTAEKPFANTVEDAFALAHQFDKATAESETAEQVISEIENQPLTDDDFGNIISEWEAGRDARTANAYDPVATENNALKQAEHNRRETQAFAEMGREIVAKIDLPDAMDFVEKEMIAAAATDMQLKAAFDLRNTDPAAAKAEMNKLRFAWDHLQRSNHPQKAQIAQAIQQRFNMAETALHSRRILTNFQQRVIDKGRKLARQQIDVEATADRELVAQSVRGASLSSPPPEPAPDIAHMSDKELRDYKRSLWGGIGGSR